MSTSNSVHQRELVKRLVDKVRDDDLPALTRIVRALAEESAVYAALENAALDDEGELSDEAREALAESRRAAAAGDVVSTEEMRRRLGL